MQHFLRKFIGAGAFQAPPGTSVRPFRIEKNYEYIELITGGNVLFEEDGVERLYSRGTLFWHIAGDLTVCRYPESAPYRCVTFKFQVSRRKRTVPRVTIPKRTERLLEFGQMIFQEYHAGNISPEFLQMAYSTFLWYASGPVQIPGETIPRAMDSAFRFIQRNISGGISLEDVAESAGVSLSYLYPLFRKHTGMSPHQYLLNQRITLAKQLLAGGHSEIKEVAMECGFGSIEVFYRQFSRCVGTTPAEYRRKYDPLASGN